MKKILFPKKQNLYKVCLHTHSTVSDGQFTPEQLKEEYLKRGYSAVAFTDHGVLVTHNDLTDKEFVALNGVEIDVAIPRKGLRETFEKCCHICHVALSPDTTRQPCFSLENRFVKKNLELGVKLDFDPTLPNFCGEYSADCVNDIIKQGVEGGFFVTYNHPCWSGERYKDYSKYQGMHAIEIYNHGSSIVGAGETDIWAYDDFLSDGVKLHCTATDDAHKLKDIGGGYVVVNADKLEYTALTKALLDGDFYSSKAPKIKEIAIEDGVVTVKTSPAKLIQIKTLERHFSASIDTVNGELVTQANMKLYPEDTGFRITIVDENGLVAYSNAYYLDQIEKE